MYLTSMAHAYPGQIVKHELNINHSTHRVELCQNLNKNLMIKGNARDSGLGDVDLYGDPPPEAPDYAARVAFMLLHHLSEL